jgi:phage terminase large subunit
MNLLVRQAVTRPQTAYAYIADTRKHCKDIGWDKVLKVSIQPLVDRGLVTVLESDLRVRFWNGSEITLYGAEHEHASALRGLHFDGVVFDEYALIAPGVWEQIVSPTIAKREGGAIFIGTPQGRNHFWSLYQKAQGWPDWFVTRIRADESGMVSAEELARQQTIQTPEQYAQEYECSFEPAPTTLANSAPRAKAAASSPSRGIRCSRSRRGGTWGTPTRPPLCSRSVWGPRFT